MNAFRSNRLQRTILASRGGKHEQGFPWNATGADRRRPASAPVALAETPGAECLDFIVDEQRLDCFDQAIRKAVHRAAAASEAGTAQPVTATAIAPQPQSLLDRAWVVDPESRKTLVRLYHPNYGLFGRYTTDVNTAPYQPLFDAFDEEGDFDSVEAKFQVSFKARLVGRRRPRPRRLVRLHAAEPMAGVQHRHVEPVPRDELHAGDSSSTRGRASSSAAGN